MEADDAKSASKSISLEQLGAYTIRQVLMTDQQDIIQPGPETTLCGLLRERVERTPEAVAYRQYEEAAGDWVPWTWQRFADAVSRWQQALAREGLETGDRIAIMLKNCREWAAFDMAAQGLGLVVVPLYANDRADNLGLILEDCGARLLLVDNDEQWQMLAPVESTLAGLQRILSLGSTSPLPGGLTPTPIGDWLPEAAGELRVDSLHADSLATIVYTSGTTGRPKGVMLSHRNILFNVARVLEQVQATREDLFLSFLPLSHMLERTGGYYLPMAAGSTVAYARSAQQLSEDFDRIQPTVIISVPRVFERVYAKVQELLAAQPALVRKVFTDANRVGWEHFLYTQGRGKWSPKLEIWKKLDDLVGPKIRYKLGGRLRCAVAGGAAITPEVAQFFIGAGIPVLQGFGATETSPVVAVNTLESNIPDSVGRPLRGVEVKLGEMDEMLTRSPSVMLGYWKNPEATSASIDAEGWFHTGDRVRIDEEGHIYIIGRIKEIIVMANGEKVPPGDMEQAIGLDPLFDQAMVVGEARPFLAALVVLSSKEYQKLADAQGLSDLASERQGERLEKILVERIAPKLKDFPGYAKIPRVAVVAQPWTVESGMMTPTLKLKRAKILDAQGADLERLYAGH
jgi:long-chain acyl-CoA synthetase